MTLNELQEKQMRTAPDIGNGKMLLNAALGLCGESGEVADIVKKANYQGHTLDTDHVMEELGDVLWYVSLCAKAVGLDLETIGEFNVAKLMKRYPDGFDSERSVHREEYEHDGK